MRRRRRGGVEGGCRLKFRSSPGIELYRVTLQTGRQTAQGLAAVSGAGGGVRQVGGVDMIM